MSNRPLNIFCTTWNTGLQGSLAQQQDLTSWLLPVLQQNEAEAPEDTSSPPDIYAIAVQELLPVHLALAGFSLPVLVALTNRIQSLLSAHATSLSPTRSQENYLLVSRVSHGGTALWVFAREATLGGRLGRAADATLGLWWGGLSNKSAVGVRVPVRRGDDAGWEVLTFVNTHLEAHDRNLPRRNTQYQNILSSLLFKSGDPLVPMRQVMDTSHLFFMGDLNYRLSRLPNLKLGQPREGRLQPNRTSNSGSTGGQGDQIELEQERADMYALDTLQAQIKGGKAFGGLREGQVHAFAPTYKRVVGQVEGYSRKRIPGWTDRILTASYTDASDTANTSSILTYSSTPELTISDHKPVHALIRLAPPSSSTSTPSEGSGASPILAPLLPAAPAPHVRAVAISREELFLWKTMGWTLDKVIGYPWCLLVLLGAGNLKAGMGVGAFVCMVWGVWWTGLINGTWSA